MLDKSHDPAAVLDGCAPSIVLCREPFHKAELIDGLVKDAGCPVIVIDADMLYSGYIRSGMIKRDNVSLLSPDRGGWKAGISGVISRISRERHLVIVDSLNGAYNMLGGLDAFQTVTSSIMMLACAGRQSGSPVIVSAMARRREDGRWVLSPGGRQLVKSRDTGVFFLKKTGGRLALSRLDEAGNPGSETAL